IVPCEFVDDIQSLDLDHVLVMVRLKLQGDFTRKLRLVELLGAESDRAGRHRTVHQSAHHRYDGRGINTPAQECPQWYLAHQAHASGFAKLLTNELAPLRF